MKEKKTHQLMRPIEGNHGNFNQMTNKITEKKIL